MPRLAIERTLNASPEAVWALLSDFCRSPAPGITVEAVHLAPDGGTGPGVERRVLIDGLRFRERLLSVGPGLRLSYTLVSGAPVNDYLGEVEIFESDGRARVTWAVRFEPRLSGTGWMVAAIAERIILRVLKLTEDAAQAEARI